MKSIKMRGVAAAVAGALMFGFGANAMADSTDDIVNALMAKGVLTEEEGALLMKGREGEKAGKAKMPVVKEKDGAFTLESGNGNNSIQLTGRMHLDYRANDISGDDLSTDPYAKQDPDSRTLADQFELRRARIGIKGKLAKYFGYEVVGNFPGTATVDVAYLDFTRFDQANLRAGKFKQPVGLEQLTSSNNIDFMERSFVDQLVPAKKIGSMVSGVPTTGMTYAGSVFQMQDTENDMDSNQASYAGRLTYNFAEGMGNKNMIAHVGLSGFNAEYSVLPTTTGNTSKASDGKTRASTFAMRTSARGLGNIYRTQIGGETFGSDNTVAYGLGNATNAQVESKAYGLEGIFAYGPYKLQGEYMDNSIKGDYKTGSVNSDVTAWYAEALWLVTGEKYADFYKKGVFGGIKPKNDMDLETGKGGLGAIELGFRVDAFDATSNVTNGTSNRVQGSTDTALRGTASDKIINTCEGTASGSKSCGDGGAIAYTAGVKWVLNPNVMFKLNYTHTKFDHAFAPIDVASRAGDTQTGGTSATNKLIDSENLIMMRAQYAF